MVPWVVRVMSHYGGLPYATGVAIFAAMSAILGLYGGAFGAIVRRILVSHGDVVEANAAHALREAAQAL